MYTTGTNLLNDCKDIRDAPEISGTSRLLWLFMRRWAIALCLLAAFFHYQQATAVPTTLGDSNSHPPGSAPGGRGVVPQVSAEKLSGRQRAGPGPCPQPDSLRLKTQRHSHVMSREYYGSQSSPAGQAGVSPMKDLEPGYSLVKHSHKQGPLKGARLLQYSNAAYTRTSKASKQHLPLGLLNAGTGRGTARVMQALSQQGDVQGAFPKEWIFASSALVHMHMAGSANLSAIGVSRSTTETSCTPAGQEAGMAGAGAGAGVKVGIIDTGVDYMHPALGGGFGSGFKVAYGYDFVGDLYGSTNSSEESTIMQPDNDPMDCIGHGTLVAGIVAGWFVPTASEPSPPHASTTTATQPADATSPATPSSVNSTAMATANVSATTSSSMTASPEAALPTWTPAMGPAPIKGAAVPSSGSGAGRHRRLLQYLPVVKASPAGQPAVATPPTGSAAPVAVGTLAPVPSSGEAVTGQAGAETPSTQRAADVPRTAVSASAEAGVTAGTRAPEQGLERHSFAGVAPGVTIGAYKIFGCSGRTTTDVVLAALARAAKDGMDIVTLALGEAGTASAPIAQAIDRLTDMGILVLTSAGDSGGSGLFMGTATASGRSAVSVASVGSPQATLGYTVWVRGAADGIDVEAGYGNVAALQGKPIKATKAALSGVAAAIAADGCNALELRAELIAGSVALLRAGGCSATQKVANAAAAGAGGVILYIDPSPQPDASGSSTADSAMGVPAEMPPMTGTRAGNTGVDGYSSAGLDHGLQLDAEAALPLPTLLIKSDAGRALQQLYVEALAKAGIVSPVAATTPPDSSVFIPLVTTVAGVQEQGTAAATAAAASAAVTEQTTAATATAPATVAPAVAAPTSTLQGSRESILPRTGAPHEATDLTGFESITDAGADAMPPAQPLQPEPSLPMQPPLVTSGQGSVESPSVGFVYSTEAGKQAETVVTSQASSEFWLQAPAYTAALAPEQAESQAPPEEAEFQIQAPPDEEAMSQMPPEVDSSRRRLLFASPAPAAPAKQEAGPSWLSSFTPESPPPPPSYTATTLPLSLPSLATPTELQQALPSSIAPSMLPSTAAPPVPSPAPMQPSPPQVPSAPYPPPVALLPSIVDWKGSFVSSFSAWGPDPHWGLKPTLAAPGGAVLTTLISAGRLQAMGDAGQTAAAYGLVSGSSQAMAYAAGAAAVLLQARLAVAQSTTPTPSVPTPSTNVTSMPVGSGTPHADIVPPTGNATAPSPSNTSDTANGTSTGIGIVGLPAQGDSRAIPVASSMLSSLSPGLPRITPASLLASLQITARPIPDANPAWGMEMPLRVGSGAIDLQAALLNMVDATPSAFELESGMRTHNFTLELVNRGSVAVTYALSHRPAPAVWVKNMLRVEAAAVAAGADTLDGGASSSGSMASGGSRRLSQASAIPVPSPPTGMTTSEGPPGDSPYSMHISSAPVSTLPGMLTDDQPAAGGLLGAATGPEPAPLPASITPVATSLGLYAKPSTPPPAPAPDAAASSNATPPPSAHGISDGEREVTWPATGLALIPWDAWQMPAGARVQFWTEPRAKAVQPTASVSLPSPSPSSPLVDSLPPSPSPAPMSTDSAPLSQSPLSTTPPSSTPVSPPNTGSPQLPTITNLRSPAAAGAPQSNMPPLNSQSRLPATPPSSSSQASSLAGAVAPQNRSQATLPAPKPSIVDAITVAAGCKARVRVVIQHPSAMLSQTTLNSGYIILTPVSGHTLSPPAASPSSSSSTPLPSPPPLLPFPSPSQSPFPPSPSIPLPPPLSIPYLGLTARAVDVPSLSPMLPAGITQAGGAEWFWDWSGLGLSVEAWQVPAPSSPMPSPAPAPAPSQPSPQPSSAGQANASTPGLTGPGPTVSPAGGLSAAATTAAADDDDAAATRRTLLADAASQVAGFSQPGQPRVTADDIPGTQAGHVGLLPQGNDADASADSFARSGMHPSPSQTSTSQSPPSAGGSDMIADSSGTVPDGSVTFEQPSMRPSVPMSPDVVLDEISTYEEYAEPPAAPDTPAPTGNFSYSLPESSAAQRPLLFLALLLQRPPGVVVVAVHAAGTDEQLGLLPVPASVLRKSVHEPSVMAWDGGYTAANSTVAFVPALLSVSGFRSSAAVLASYGARMPIEPGQYTLKVYVQRLAASADRRSVGRVVYDVWTSPIISILA